MPTPTVLTHGDRRALRAPDGTFMTLPEGHTADAISAQLAERRAARQAPRPTIHVHAETPELFNPVRSAIEQATAPVPHDAPTATRALALVALETPTAAQAADDLLAQGTAVLRVHREDDVLWVHPLADPADEQAIRATDAHARRLAACPAPALMQSLAHDPGPDSLRDLPEHVIPVLVGELITRVAGWLHGNPRTGPAHLTRIEMTPLRVSTHPVIRVPEAEPLPAS